LQCFTVFRSPSLSASALLVGVVSLGLASAAPAQALTVSVTVGGQNYAVSTGTAVTYDGNESLFATPTNGGVMPWYDSDSLAAQFATAVGTSLGTPNDTPFGSFGPFFADASNGVFVSASYLSGGSVLSDTFDSFAGYVYATATLQPPASAVPSPLPLLGTAAAFRLSRQLRRRLKSAA
jgi:hypothetical protein